MSDCFSPSCLTGNYGSIGTSFSVLSKWQILCVFFSFCVANLNEDSALFVLLISLLSMLVSQSNVTFCIFRYTETSNQLSPLFSFWNVYLISCFHGMRVSSKHILHLFSFIVLLETSC